MQFRLLHHQVARMAAIPHPRQGGETWDILWWEGERVWGWDGEVVGVGVRGVEVGVGVGVGVRGWVGWWLEKRGRWTCTRASGGRIVNGISSGSRDRAFAGSVVSAALARAAARARRAEARQIRRRWWWWRVVGGHHHAGRDHIGEHIRGEVLH